MKGSVQKPVLVGMNIGIIVAPNTMLLGNLDRRAFSRARRTGGGILQAAVGRISRWNTIHVRQRDGSEVLIGILALNIRCLISERRESDVVEQWIVEFVPERLEFRRRNSCILRVSISQMEDIREYTMHLTWKRLLSSVVAW